MNICIILLASIFSATAQYISKYLVDMKISKRNYFYYMCFSIIPFSLFMVIVEFFTSQLKFNFNIESFILLILAIYFRYKKESSIVGCLTYLKAYEDSAYLTLVIIFAFIIDVILGIEYLDYISIISILFTVAGIFLLINTKLKIKNLRKDLIIRIGSVLIMGYITHYILQYFSIAVYMLLLNLLICIIFSKGYTFKYHKQHSKLIKQVFIQQIFGFISLYLSNYLILNSVTMSSYVKPMTIIIIVIIAIFYKDKSKKINLRHILAIILVLSGILLINF